MLGHYSTIVGIGLCLAIFFYLSYVARKAVDDELGYGPLSGEETEAFLSGDEDGGEDRREMMAELPHRPSRHWSRSPGPGPVRLDSSTNDRFEHGGHEEASIGL